MKSFVRFELRFLKNNWLKFILSYGFVLVGFFFFTYVVLVLKHEFSYNKKLNDQYDIFQVATSIGNENSNRTISSTLVFVGPRMQSSIADIVNFTRVRKRRQNVEFNGKLIDGLNVAYVDVDFFKVFDLMNAQVRIAPNQYFISEDLYTRIGLTEEVHSNCKINNDEYIFSGIFTNSRPSDFIFDIVVLIDTRELDEFDWIKTYVAAIKGTPEEKIEGLYAPYFNQILEGNYNENVLDIRIDLQNLTEFHFTGNEVISIMTNERAVLNALLFSSLLFLLLVIINDLFLTILLTANRYKFLFLRWLYGASNKQSLILLFIEKVVFYFLVVALVVPLVNLFWSTDNLHLDLEVVLILLIIVICAAIINTAISYLILVKKREGMQLNVQVISHTFKIILAIQIAVLLVSLSFIGLTYTQGQLYSSLDYGLQTEDIRIIEFNRMLTTGEVAFIRNRLNDDSRIESSSFAEYNSIPGRSSEIQLFRLNNASTESEFIAEIKNIELTFFEIFGIEKQIFFPSSNLYEKAIVNFSLAKIVNLIPQQKNSLNRYEVVGISNDYFNNSIYEPIKPVVFTFNPINYNTLIVKLKKGQSNEILGKILNTASMNLFFEIQDFESLYHKKFRDEISRYDLLNRLNLTLSLTSIFGMFLFLSVYVDSRIKDNLIRIIYGATKIDIVRAANKSLAVYIIGSILVSISLNTLLSRTFFRSFFSISTDTLSIIAGIQILIVCVILIFYIVFLLVKIRDKNNYRLLNSIN
jgi:hypothetical protein